MIVTVVFARLAHSPYIHLELNLAVKWIFTLVV